MKVKTLKELKVNIANVHNQDKSVVLCHGCFDLVHYGHLRHFIEAKQQGDILVVTVTEDRYITKGDGRPFFTQQQRCEFLSALEILDYVAINQWKSAANTIRMLSPDIYVKGREYLQMQDEVKMMEELEAIESVGGRVYYTTDDIVFSSTELINKGLIPENLNQQDH